MCDDRGYKEGYDWYVGLVWYDCDDFVWKWCDVGVQDGLEVCVIKGCVEFFDVV